MNPILGALDGIFALLQVSRPAHLVRSPEAVFLAPEDVTPCAGVGRWAVFRNIGHFIHTRTGVLAGLAYQGSLHYTAEGSLLDTLWMGLYLLRLPTKVKRQQP